MKKVQEHVATQVEAAKAEVMETITGAVQLALQAFRDDLHHELGSQNNNSQVQAQ